MWVHRLADSDATCGGKAVALARLIAAGLPVPDGFVIDSGAFACIAGLVATDPDAIGHTLAAAADRIATADVDAALVAEVEARTRVLGMCAVRSSATIEDAAAGSAAGVFSSRTAVPPAEVWGAIRAVWTSALTPLAASYARRRGGELAIGVIVQRFVAGEPITIYTRPPGAPSGELAWIQRGAGVTRVARDAGDPLVALALRAEAAIDARTGADVELVVSVDGSPCVVQARPIVHPVPRVEIAVPPIILAPLVADGRRWTWDVAHNPDPLSVAQAELVERVDRAAIAPWSMRVCAGMLYTAPIAGHGSVIAPASRDALLDRARVIEAAMAVALGDDREALPVEVALERYLACYAAWSELGGLIASVRAVVGTPGARPSAVEATLLAAAAGELDETEVLARIGMLAPAWDVAVPTFAEQPDIVRAAITRARGVSRTRADAPPADLATAAADLAERDDVWFARAQWMVRRALLARADALAIDRTDIFWLPLDTPALDREDAHRRASAARDAAARAVRWTMPLVVGGEAASSPPPLHGIGSGAAVSGRVVRFASLAAAVAVGRGDVVVVRAVTPALAVFVIGCAALVSETGGPLDHGAALARELGIPCVVGCTDAWTLLTDGTAVTVDGDAGTVTLTPEG